jgi:hypothetical protein
MNQAARTGNSMLGWTECHRMLKTGNWAGAETASRKIKKTGRELRSKRVLDRSTPVEKIERAHVLLESQWRSDLPRQQNTKPTKIMRVTNEKEGENQTGEAQDNLQLNLLPTGADWSSGAKLPLNWVADKNQQAVAKIFQEEPIPQRGKRTAKI